MIPLQYEEDVFRANHASNCLPLKAVLLRDQDLLLARTGKEGRIYVTKIWNWRG
ncbi:MAG: hypothetical protein R6U91_09300 [Bacillota bacterium]